MRLQLDEAADRRRRALAHRDAHAVGRFSRRAAFETMHADDDAVAALALLADFDKAGQRHARDRRLQHRMRDAYGLAASQWQSRRRWRQSRAPAAKPIARRRATNAMTMPASASAAAAHQAGSRSAVKYADDAEAEGDRQPGHQPPRRDFGDRPLRQQTAEPGGAVGQPGRQHDAGAPPRGVDRPQALARVRRCSLSAMARRPRRSRNLASMLSQPQVVARRTVVNAHTVIAQVRAKRASVRIDGLARRLFLGLVLRPGVAQADGAVEHQPLRASTPGRGRNSPGARTAPALPAWRRPAPARAGRRSSTSSEFGLRSAVKFSPPLGSGLVNSGL